MGKGRSRKRARKSSVRILSAGEGVGMTEAEAKKFLVDCRSVVKLGTIDASGDPNVHPVWYCFDPDEMELYAFVGAGTKKLRNLEKRPRIYFDVDDDRWPPKGVRGKGEAKVLPVSTKTIAIVDKMLARYIRRDHPMFDNFLDRFRKGFYFIVEVTPSYLSTWDYGKLPRESLKAGLSNR